MMEKNPSQTYATPATADGALMTEGRNGKQGALVIVDRDFRKMVERMEANQQTIIQLLTEIRDART